VLPVRKYQPDAITTAAIASIPTLFLENFIGGARLSSGTA